ncbi:mutS protein homolog 4 isoform X2 [Cephus cinctus]|nr:mutS protein homolog 4 isoform X2 [Cephus cinctus]
MITPGTSSSITSLVILAITAGRGDAKCEVGMAAVDLQQPHMILCQISDCQTYINTLTKIHYFQPVEILMPDTMCERPTSLSRLYQFIKEKFKDVNVTGIGRWHFNDTIGMDRIRTHCANEYSSVELFVKQKFYALAAAAALLKYVEYIQHILYAPKSMRIEFQGSQNSTTIDLESALSLELVSAQAGRANISLFGTLDRCSTPMGRKLLRASILQPPCVTNDILERQKCVAELVNNKSLLMVIQATVRRFSGVDHLHNLSMQTLHDDNVLSAERNLNSVLLLKHTIDAVPVLHAVLETAKSSFFIKTRKNLQDSQYGIMKEKILKVIQPEARSVAGFTSANMQRCFALKAGISDMLDVARQTYCELIDDMKSMVQGLNEKYNLPLALGCSATMGYHIQMEVPRRRNIKVTDLPKEFIEIKKVRSWFYMTTDILLVQSQHCKDACDELHLMSNVILNETLTEIREHIGCLYQLSADIAELDLVTSHALISSIQDYVKPIFGLRLNLVDSKHPIMDIMGTDNPTPNDVEASVPYNFHTIIGPNMSGKSVYLRQIILLQIMAQIGCYVPATKAEFRIADRIYCTLCFGDDIECNASSFVREVKEVQYILQTITPRSLIVIDELCRGTTVEEGTSLVWAICESLLCTAAFTFCATHFLYLTRLTELYNNVINHYFETKPRIEKVFEKTRLIYTHKLKTGIETFENYGISLAESCNLPDCVIKHARENILKISDTIMPGKDIIENSAMSQNKKWYKYAAEVYDLLENDNKFTEQNVLELITQMQQFDIEDPDDTTKIMIAQSNPVAQHTPINKNKYKKSCSNLAPIISKHENLSAVEKRKATDSIGEYSDSKLIKFEFLSESKKVMPTQMSKQESKLSKKKCTVVNLTSLKNRTVKLMDEEFTSFRDIVRKENNENPKPELNLQVEKSYSAERNIQLPIPKLPNRLSQPITPDLSEDKSVTFSQTSISTLAAKLSARRKEAEIFKIIEGDDFRESQFFNSLRINDDENDIMIIENNLRGIPSDQYTLQFKNDFKNEPSTSRGYK